MKKISEYKINKTGDYRILLNSNENNKLFLEGEMIDILLSLKDVELNRYPETSSQELRKAYGKVIGIDENNILAGNGSDQLIGTVVSTFINKGKTVLTLDPDFSMYDFYTSINEGKLVKLSTKKDGSFSMDNLIELAQEVEPSLIVFSNPNNPTGHAVSIKEIKRLLATFKYTKILIDEAYVEFGGESMISYIDEFDNLLITRTLSKAWGLAAIRVGFLISANKNIKLIAPFMVPYNLNTLSQQIAVKTLAYSEEVNQLVEQIKENRESFYENLKEIEITSNKKIRFYKSKGNFVFGRSCYKNEIKQKFDELGILIRYFKDDTFRITIGETFELDEVIKGLMEVVKEI